jgi:hypothetical protein
MTIISRPVTDRSHTLGYGVGCEGENSYHNCYDYISAKRIIWRQTISMVESSNYNAFRPCLKISSDGFSRKYRFCSNDLKIINKLLDLFCNSCENVFIVSCSVQKEKKKSKWNIAEDLKVSFDLDISCVMAIWNILML